MRTHRPWANTASRFRNHYLVDDDRLCRTRKISPQNIRALPEMIKESADGESAADNERFAGQVAAVAQLPDPVGDFVWPGGATQRNGLDCFVDPSSRSSAWRVDPARRDCVDGDVVSAQLDRQRTGQRDDSSLGCAVKELASRHREGVDGCEVDDGATA